MLWLIGLVVPVVIGAGYYFDKMMKKVGWSNGTKSESSSGDAKASENASSGFGLWTWLFLICSAAGGLWWWLRKPKIDSTKDYYVGLLGLDPIKALAMSKSHLSGLARKAKDDQYNANSQTAGRMIAGLPVTGLTARYGKTYDENKTWTGSTGSQFGGWAK